ncbi:hypothetical protein C0971_09965 [Bacillus methanolicus]|uniref:hypothetical protein n=1 Tax=Bacillus methanolicus TaxID=1471 RepID=UPI00200BAFD7|nr:hypothetical protein [Bacillus methanolicus]UQD52299.1 hypothetical protein C0971_09965 [Bacillus methanolicus]
MITEWLSKLTDNYKKDPNSSIGKLLSVIYDEIEELKSVFQKIEDWRNINKAEGTTLDLTGENIGQPRGKATDEIYRVMIRAKEVLNQSDGTINKIIEVLAAALDCKPSDINIASLKESGEDEPAALIVKKAPLGALNKIGMTPGQFVQIVERAVASGVRVASVNLEGTFSFASGNSIEESEFGFSDIEGTTGGTLGGVFMSDQDYELPV